MRVKNHFYISGFALSPTLKQMLEAIWKWAILCISWRVSSASALFALAGNTLLDLHNSLGHTQLHLIIIIIIIRCG